MLKKELIEAINVFLINSDLVDICVNNDEFEVRFASKKEQSSIPIVISKPQSLVNSISVESDQTMDDDAGKQEDKIIWPPGKKPNEDIVRFEKALRQYIAEHPDEGQNEISKAFGVSNFTVCIYIKRFHIPYNMKRERMGSPHRNKRSDKPQKITLESSPDLPKPQKIVLEEKYNDNQITSDPSNNFKNELYAIIRKALFDIYKSQEEVSVLKKSFNDFREAGHKFMSSNLGTWILKPSNGFGGSPLEFIGLAVLAEYQICPKWEAGKGYCILQFYGNSKTAEYLVQAIHGEIRVSRRP